jgi:hypothetical protein
MTSIFKVEERVKQETSYILLEKIFDSNDGEDIFFSKRRWTSTEPLQPEDRTLRSDRCENLMSSFQFKCDTHTNFGLNILFVCVLTAENMTSETIEYCIWKIHRP